MMTNVIIWLIERVVPPLVGLVLYAIVFIVLGAGLIFLGGFSVKGAAAMEVAIVAIMFFIDTDTR